MSMKPINVTIPEQMIEQLNQYKKTHGIALSEVIRRACDMFFSNIKQNTKEPPNAQ